MSKGTRNIILGVVAIILVFIIITIIYQQYGAKPINANETKGNVLSDANSGLDNMLNQIFGEEETDNKEENNVTNDIENNNQNTENALKPENTQSTNSNKENNNTEQTAPGMTQRESKAIELVKEEWKKQYGDLDGVSFNVSIQSDGKYGVTVYNVVTTQTIKFFIVDVDTEVVRER